MYGHDVSVQEFIYCKAFGIILEKVLTIRGITKNELANSTSLNVSKILKGDRRVSNDERNNILEVVRIDDTTWYSMQRDVMELLLNNETANSIEIWMVIIHHIYDEEGKKSKFKTPVDDSNWDT
jgi:plasmid maintenance system antidote protein VapI